MPHDAPVIDQDIGDSISGTHRRALEKVFQHPLTHNLTWRAVTHLFETIGTAEHRHNGDLMLGIGSEHLSVKPARGKDLGATEVMDVRHLLVRAGWSSKPAEQPTQSAPGVPDVMIVIDHAGARVYRLDAGNPTMAFDETHHLRHEHIGRKDHDADREENYPADARFFEAVVAAVPQDGRIVLISHGKGQSSEAEHLVKYLSQHHPEIEARVTGSLVADLPHITLPEIVELARDALGTTPSAPVGEKA